MRVVLGVAAALVFAVGLVAYRAAWLCYRDPDRAGFWLDPRAGLILFAFLAGMAAPLVTWLERGIGLGGWAFAWRCAVFILILVLYLPLLTHYAGRALARILNPLSQPPPEPADPFERARAAEERGDVRTAIERYSTLLDARPTHVEARTRFAQLLARTRRLAWGKDIIGRGLALEGVPGAEKAKWKVLLRDWEEGRLGETPPVAAGGGEE